jgi:uncharacterized protein (DUF433 family)
LNQCGIPAGITSTGSNKHWSRAKEAGSLAFAKCGSQCKDVLSYLAVGMTQEQILADFPYLEKDDILALMLLNEARILVSASIAGENVQDFEDEFTSYWERWDRTKAMVNLICNPRGPSRTLTAWFGTKTTFVAENETALRLWLKTGSVKTLLRN